MTKKPQLLIMFGYKRYGIEYIYGSITENEKICKGIELPKNCIYNYDYVYENNFQYLD